MKYKILVEGGFTGIPKIFEGELDLNAEESSRLFALMMEPEEQNEQLRDGYRYNVSLSDSDVALSAIFNDNNLPQAIRGILARLD